MSYKPLILCILASALSISCNFGVSFNFCNSTYIPCYIFIVVTLGALVAAAKAGATAACKAGCPWLKKAFKNYVWDTGKEYFDAGVDWAKEQWESSCLLGNAQILMGDNTTKAISDIQSGEVILDGNLNHVTVKAVVTNYLYDRPLFEFKNGPIFTDEHLFYADLEKEILGM